MENLSSISYLSSLPDLPGVYQFFDSTGKIIYIGKAKNLRKRVSSYFNRSQYDSAKVRALVSRVADLKYIVVNSESDALILENILIKKHQPKYNILLRDDKTYPWIVIKNEPFPRVTTTRRYENDGSIYYGPYTSGRLLKALLDLIRQLFPIRTCELNLTQSNIASGKFKACLEYQIGNCLAPCIGNQKENDYLSNINAIKKILEGDLNEVLRLTTAEMTKAAQELKFEQAALLKERLRLLQNFQAKSSVISKGINTADIFTIQESEGFAVVNYLKVNSGVVVQSYNLQIKNIVDEPIDDIFSQAILEIKERLNLKSTTFLVNINPAYQLSNIKYHIPKQGEKLKLLKLSLRNADAYIKELIKSEERANPQTRALKYLEQLKKDLQLPELPMVIECFDNSNLQGTNPVSACVVFKNGKPAKSEYRHFNVKTVTGPDDFASMREVVYRRYKRLIEEKKNLPNLIVIDGGKGQLSSAYETLKDLHIEHIPIIGIAKRLEEIYRPGDTTPLYLDKRSMSLKLIQNIRDEAHRFGITFHRKKREKKNEASILESIPGVGKKSVIKLYTRFKSLENIKMASLEELSEEVGAKTASNIVSFFKKI
ncbi:MAG: excinuclease ABC subunit UvrC [Tenuifilum sp.]|uniref:excinuclease ABC subunit UvrC n=1 Tax=Tenuifilum sp. TaxID=2760880 RepID=UPI002B63985D|nr:excinuclease ABC subunit UvrC [Tenuifilum sp.]HOK85120.1 excinuclease ABC subunit UvrC [Tenuifilum sp.]HOU73285.1 excinuclease ABC subunit UvrC [Tenuifilum sp.]HPP89570.1 excinuclease ABC subunit UvrC [Tenuifilum sp.]HQE53975.1 excinuclease ABC subunit UvrC [Tenuifilum sp.]